MWLFFRLAFHQDSSQNCLKYNGILKQWVLFFIFYEFFKNSDKNFERHTYIIKQADGELKK
jgi:hypothetical protein